VTSPRPDPTDAQPSGAPDTAAPPAGGTPAAEDPAPVDGVPGAEVPAAEVPGAEVPAREAPGDAVAAPDDRVAGDGAAGDEAAGDEAAGDLAPTDVARGGRSWRRAVLLVGIALVVLAIDQITKAIVAATIDIGENVRILGGLVYLTQIRNAGAAFSMATGMTWVLAIVALAVVAFIVRMAPKLRSTPWAVCLGLVLGGALGNLSDRIFRAPGFLQGHVVDFISVFAPNAERFPAFNAADSAITVGGVMLVLIALLGYDFDGTRHRGRRTDG